MVGKLPEDTLKAMRALMLAATVAVNAHAQTTTTVADSTKTSDVRSACAMLTAAEMSKILGTEVTTAANDRSSQTKCEYTAARGGSAYVEVMLSWGDGDAGMAGAGMADAGMPGMVNPYQGLGDKAVAVGTMLMIKRAEDLITLTFSGIDDMPGKAKQIYQALDKRLNEAKR